MSILGKFLDCFRKVAKVGFSARRAQKRDTKRDRWAEAVEEQDCQSLSIRLTNDHMQVCMEDSKENFWVEYDGQVDGYGSIVLLLVDELNRRKRERGG